MAPLYAQANAFDQDRRGAVDHPVLSRYQGSVLYMTGGENLGRARIADLDKGKVTLRAVEGRISNRFYFAPAGRSALEVQRNYLQALTAAGFKPMISCEVEQCARLNLQGAISDLPRNAAWDEGNAVVSGIFNSGNQPFFHYVSARKEVPGGTMYVQVGLVGSPKEPPINGRVRQFMQIIEPATLEDGKVLVDMKGIQQGLQRDGKIALYGVHFDTGKAVIRDESSEQLKQMAAALKAEPSLKVFIVGHTDSQGDFESNIALSQRRAQAVVDALSTRHGIAANRLTARGVASLSPVSANTSEDGRAKNRRVELVVR